MKYFKILIEGLLTFLKWHVFIIDFSEYKILNTTLNAHSNPTKKAKPSSEKLTSSFAYWTSYFCAESHSGQVFIVYRIPFEFASKLLVEDYSFHYFQIAFHLALEVSTGAVKMVIFRVWHYRQFWSIKCFIKKHLSNTCLIVGSMPNAAHNRWFKTGPYTQKLMVQCSGVRSKVKLFLQ